MSDLSERLAGLSPAQRALLEKRLAAKQSQQPQPLPPPEAEPIAIIGMACRFPGSPDLDAFWKLISEGRSAVSEVPAERWDPDQFYDPSGETPGKMSVRWAALVDRPGDFDPQFFGITPREATRMDPQQRLLLEVAWETMENAGRPADQMAGTKTGVFVGIGATDYSKVSVPYDDYYERIDAHMGTGNALSIAANRVSYIFDLHGPSAAVDTACSSSSLAIHFAVESLRRGESDAALAGGVNMILTPETTIAFSKARMLSPEGKCRPFDAGANGYVRGEGCGLVMLKRLADAERDGDKVLAVLRATSVNQDGRTSGISAPNGQSQIACIRSALKQAGLTPDHVNYIEAHGTGTPLGDPIEMQALGEIFRTDDASAPPVHVSSVKANVGHMETVSGVAGLIKVVLMMEHDAIVPQTHFESLNPHIQLGGTRLVIPTKETPWSRGGQRQVAGVSSFGFGGTNTHLVLEGPAEEQAAPAKSERPLQLLKLSAKSEAAVAREAESYATYLAEHADVRIADFCYSVNTGKADFNYRAVLAATDAKQLREQLSSVAAGKLPSGGKQNTVRTIARPKVAFLFTGQGLQYPGMGRALYESHAVFREAIDACDDILSELWDGESLVDILYPKAAANTNGADDPKALIHQTQYTQPALFALEFALSELWQSWGVEPAIVLGHSVGEYAAACAAGVMGLEDGLALIAERARLMQGVKQHGKMAVVFAPPEKVSPLLAKHGGKVVIAVLNGSENTVISGDAEAVEAAAAEFAAAGVQTKLLQVSHAFHSPLMDEMLEEFEEFAAGIEFQRPQVPIAANLTGQLLTEAPTPRYWRDHLRNAVRFAEGMARVAEAAPTAIIEIGPTASLLGMGRRCVPELETAWLPSLRQGQDDWQTLAASVAEYYVRGGQIDWREWDEPWPRRRLRVPNYPFERARHWLPTEGSTKRSFGGAAVATTGEATGNPLLGARLSTVWTNTLFESVLSARQPAYLVDHQVQGSAVTPAAAYVEQALAAADQVFGAGRHGVANLVIQQAMFLPEGARRRVQFSIAPESGGEATFETYSKPADAEQAAAPWVMHANGSLVHESNGGEAPARVDLMAVRDRATSVTTHRDFYDAIAKRGLAYGPAFQVLHDLHRSADEATSEVRLPESVAKEAPRYHVHPALGDAMLQSMSGAVPLEKDGSFSPFTYMPVGIRRVRVLRAIEDYSQPLYTCVRRTSNDASPNPERVEADVFLVDAAGEVLVAMEGVAVQRLGRSAGGGAAVDTREWLYRIKWQPSEIAAAGEKKAAAAAAGAWLILSDSRGVGAALADQLASRGEACVVVKHGSEFKFLGSGSTNGKPGQRESGTIDVLDEVHYRRVLQEAFVDKGRTCLGVVHLWSLDIPEQNLVAARAFGTASTLQLVKVLTRSPLAPAPHVWFVTGGAQAVDAAPGAAVAIEQAPLVGLVRVAAMELPDLQPRLVDFDPAGVKEDADAAAAALVRELSASGKESEIAYRNGQRFVARLARDPALVAADGAAGASLTVPVGKPFQLRITQSGSFDALRFVPVEREAPQAGQVEIEVRATGLNFSDVLKALGLYPGIKDAIVPLGIEASGVVTAVGEGVTRFKVGDEVFGVVPYAFASHARTAEYALVAKPKSIDHDEACTVPITFLTAYYGLVRLAQMQPGERLLIHAGAGGVGLAAIQIAQHLGVEIYATAGSDEKREFLRSLGVKHVYSSRSTAFAEEILADTNREGVDVVLNSLPGEAITKSLSILRAYGRFLEIGKTDIYQNRMIGLLPFQDNLSYFAIDLDRMLRQRPDYIRNLFAEVMTFFEAGHYRPLMFTRFEAEGTIDAFRYMSQRKNIGKVVVAFEGGGRRAEGGRPEKTPDAIVRKDGAYLVTGGLGALGLRVGEWLAEQGAGTVALLARRSPSAEVETQLDAIRGKGARVVCLQGDVTDAVSLQAAIGQIPRETPLRGVIHAAGVLADGVLADMTLDQLDRAMLPKVTGTWNLHLATEELPLDFFVMFSSVASVLGSPGQGNYAAGNALLDALASARRAMGLPATAINWGPWAGSGMAAEAGRGDAVKSKGMNLIPPDAGLDLLGKLLTASVPQVAVMDAQWGDLLKLLGSRRPALLDEVASEVQGAAGAESGSRVDHAFRKELAAVDGETRLALVRSYIQQELARIMGVAPESLETDRQLSTFGLDSLLALELKNNLESRLDLTLPMAKLMEGPTIASLAEATVGIIFGDSGAGVATIDGAAVRPLAEASSPAAEWEALYALQPEGSKPPLVLLPALGGDSRYYAELVASLGEDQPAYAFRPRGIDQDLPPHQVMDDMVADYAAALRKLQPHGPYYLAGWSTGAIYAFALAQALESVGEEVGFVAMFGAPLPSICDELDVEDEARFLCDLVNFANCFTGTKSRVDYDELLALPPAERFGAVLAAAKRQGTLPESAPEDYIRRLVRVGEANVRVIQGYQPRPIHAPVHFFHPTVGGGLAEVSGRAWDESGDHGWGSEVGQTLELHKVPGDHFTMMVGGGAAKIAAVIQPLLASEIAAKK